MSTLPAKRILALSAARVCFERRTLHFRNDLLPIALLLLRFDPFFHELQGQKSVH
jgi:hypothetical protein